MGDTSRTYIPQVEIVGNANPNEIPLQCTDHAEVVPPERADRKSMGGTGSVPSANGTSLSDILMIRRSVGRQPVRRSVPTKSGTKEEDR